MPTGGASRGAHGGSQVDRGRYARVLDGLQRRRRQRVCPRPKLRRRHRQQSPHQHDQHPHIESRRGRRHHALLQAARSCSRRRPSASRASSPSTAAAARVAVPRAGPTATLTPLQRSTQAPWVAPAALAQPSTAAPRSQPGRRGRRRRTHPHQHDERKGDVQRNTVAGGEHHLRDAGSNRWLAERSRAD